MIVAQVRSVAEDIGVDAVKIGMLGSAETVDAVVEALDLVGEAPVVVDPVMVAESGAVLLDDDAREALVEPAAATDDGRHPEHPRGSGAGRGGGGGRPGGPGARDAGPGPRRGRRHRRPQRPVVDVFLDGDRARRDRRRAPPRWRRPRLRLHPLLGAGRRPRARRDAARGRRRAREVASEAVGAGLREHRRRAGTGRRLRSATRRREARRCDSVALPELVVDSP